MAKPFDQYRHFVRWFCLVFALVILSGGFAGPVRAADETLDAFLQRLTAQSASVSSFQCDFRQERHLAIFAKPVIFTGLLAMVRPDRLRWEFTDPIPSTLIFAGDRGMRCGGTAVPQQFDLAADPVMGTVARQLRAWVGGDYGSLGDLYRMELLDGPGLLLFPLDPAMAGFMESIRVAFDVDTLRPVQVRISEQGGDYTLLVFADYQLNISLDDSRFAGCGDQ